MAKPTRAGWVYCMYNISAVCFPGALLSRVLLTLLLALPWNLQSRTKQGVGLAWWCLHYPDYKLLMMLGVPVPAVMSHEELGEIHPWLCPGHGSMGFTRCRALAVWHELLEMVVDMFILR